MITRYLQNVVTLLMIILYDRYLLVSMCIRFHIAVAKCLPFGFRPSHFRGAERDNGVTNHEIGNGERIARSRAGHDAAQTGGDETRTREAEVGNG